VARSAGQGPPEGRGRKKNGERYYGDKNHVKVDSRSKLIEGFTVTDASVHDSNALEELIAAGDPVTYVDSAYTGARCEQIFAERKVEAKSIERAYRNKPLNGRQQRRNRARSKIRVRVEHVFATMRMGMRSAWHRGLGMTRNRAAIAPSRQTGMMMLRRGDGFTKTGRLSERGRKGEAHTISASRRGDEAGRPCPRPAGFRARSSRDAFPPTRAHKPGPARFRDRGLWW
jgi:hypothetical protein